MNYVVQPGDNLYSIAARFGVTVEEIIRANRLQPPFVIYIGQTLFIPRGGPTPPPPPGPRPDNLERRVTRLEREVNRLDRRIDNLERRVDRLERRPRT